MVPRKRKSGGKGWLVADMTEPATETAVVPAGLVTDRINQLGSASNRVEEDAEGQKKQKIVNKYHAKSARVVVNDPRRAQ